MYSNDSSFAEGFIAGQNGAMARNDCGCGCNNNGMWGDQSWWFIIVLFALWGGFGGNGWGNNGGYGAANAFLPYAVGANGALTRGELCQDMNFSDLESGVRGIQQGLCDGFYAMNTSVLNGFHGVDNAVCSLGYQTQQGFNGVDNAICNLGYQTQQGFNQNQLAVMQAQNALQGQISNCCCDLKSGLKDIQFQNATDTCAIQTSMANNTRDIIDNQNCNTRQIIDFLVNDKICTLQSENQELRLAASQERQNNYLVNTLRPCPSPAYITCNPFTGGYGYAGYGNFGNNCGCGCGCNSGCGC